MSEVDAEKQGIPEEEIQVGFFRPEDAEGIVALFHAVYGAGYPVRLFYDAAALTRANETGQCYSIVARTPSGKVVGVDHLFRSAPFPKLYEIGSGLVLKDYRRQGINRRIMGFIFTEWVATQPGIEETWGEPVCNHLQMQKTVCEFNHAEMALEVALMPAEAYDKEKSAGGRVATLAAFKSYRSKPHDVYLPKPYERELRFLYSGLDDVRALDLSEESIPRFAKTRGELTVFDFARTARIAIHSIGDDFAAYVADLETTACDRNAVVVQIWVNLGCPWVGSAVDILRARGYFLGGPLPRWFDTDGLLMQKVRTDPAFDSIQLYSDRAKEICAMVKEDWSRTQRS
jgi:GNAT superfamily N-acetyltransferase